MSEKDSDAAASLQVDSIENLLKAQASASARPPVPIDGDTVVMSFTLVESATALTKRIDRDADGSLKKTNSAPLSRGVARRKRLRGSPSSVVKQFSDVLAAVGTNEAIIGGPPAEPQDAVKPDRGSIPADRHAKRDAGQLWRATEGVFE